MLSLNATTCTPTNTTCLCTDEFFGNVVAACVQSSCTIRDQLRVMNGTASNCGRREPDPKNSLIAITVVLIALQTIFFVLRMLCRIVRIAPWGWDDTTIVMAFVGCALAPEAHLGPFVRREILTSPPSQHPDPHHILYSRLCPRTRLWSGTKHMDG